MKDKNLSRKEASVLHKPDERQNLIEEASNCPS
jgi:hypothetical protein